MDNFWGDVKGCPDELGNARFIVNGKFSETEVNQLELCLAEIFTYCAFTEYHIFGLYVAMGYV